MNPRCVAADWRWTAGAGEAELASRFPRLVDLPVILTVRRSCDGGRFAGEERDFDINLDGMAHYGMLPDLLQDMRNIGLTAEDFIPLFRSAYDYVQMWGTCVKRAANVAAGLASDQSEES